MFPEPFSNALILTGPTGSGKTLLGVALAERLGAEIVSMDSMVLYRGMDIGTAKPAVAERQGVPHHLIDVLDPWESASVAWWLERAADCCRDIERRGRRVLFVGGTPLYLKALLRGLFDGPPADPELRQRLAREVEKSGSQALHERLAQVDPASAGRIHPHDTRRIIRALEVWELTGRPISSWQVQWESTGDPSNTDPHGRKQAKIVEDSKLAPQSPGQTAPSPPASGGEGWGEGCRNSAPQHESMHGALTPSPPAPLPRSGGEGSNSSPPAKILDKSSTREQNPASPAMPAVFYLDLPRPELYARIDARVRRMFDEGLVDEVRTLRQLPRPPSREASQALGYKEVFDLLVGQATLEETIARVQTRSRNFAKRQLTWFRHLSECRPVGKELTNDAWGLTIR